MPLVCVTNPNVVSVEPGEPLIAPPIRVMVFAVMLPDPVKVPVDSSRCPVAQSWSNDTVPPPNKTAPTDVSV